jgi:hypothetical protein
MESYVFNDVDNRIRDSGWLKGLCLSPRGVIGPKKMLQFIWLFMWITEIVIIAIFLY